MLHKAMLSLFLLAAAAFPVAAQDKPFDGLYLGAEIGFADFDLDIDIDDPDVSFDDGGTMYGAFVGLRRQYDSGFVVGLEARLAKPDFDLDIFDDPDRTLVEPKSQYGLDGVVGFVPAALPGTLFFGKVGYAFVRTRTDLSGTVDESDTDTDGAFRWGGGIEQALLPFLSVRASAVRTNYGTVSGVNLDDWQYTAGLVLTF